MELAAYFTHCNLQPAHLALALNVAMSQTYKGGNFINAAAFARRILELPEGAAAKSDLRSKAVVVLKKSEEKARNDHKLDYDERNPFEIACDELTPLYKGTLSTQCAYCGAYYHASYKGGRCEICKLSSVGVETLGLVTQSRVKR